MNEITEVTRRAIFDAIQIRQAKWYGRLDDIEFLARMFDLGSLPSTDSRHADMAGDISRHRFMNDDWDEGWVFSDPRLDLLHTPDDRFLQFLCEMVHPLVRSGEDEIDGLVATFNRYLTKDGFQVFPVDYISGRRLFSGAKALPGVQSAITGARAIADELSSEHVTAQINRMQASIVSDPALAIGSAKEFVESLCKAILAARGFKITGHEDLSRLSTMTRDALGLKVNPKADVTLKSMTGALATITQTIAELRGLMGTGHGGAPDKERPPVAVARLAVGVSMAFGVFLWDTHRAMASKEPGP